jgi:enoyl-CoA hydratase/carnithine racemase
MSNIYDKSLGKLNYYVEGFTGHLIFDNPSKFNAITYDMWCELPGAIDALVTNSAVRVIVLSGAGEKAFVSGADISQFGQEREGSNSQRYNQATELGYAAVLDCVKPTIAKVRGICMGGGLGLALNCDVRICADDAKFRMPAGRLGLGYAFDGVKRFTEVIGVSNTADLFYSARIFDANEALRMGLVKQVLPANELDAFVQSFSLMVSENAPRTLAAVKRALIELRKNPDSRNIELINSMVQDCFDSEDYYEGRRAFADKRKPIFKNQ